MATNKGKSSSRRIESDVVVVEETTSRKPIPKLLDKVS